MIDPDLPTLQRAAVHGTDGQGGDARAVYRWRVAAVRAGLDLWPVAGDLVVLGDGRQGRVLAAEETAAGPPRVVALADDGVAARGGAWRVVGPHRPAVLLGEDELRARLAEDLAHPTWARAHETLLELARRGPRHAVDVALDLIPRLDDDERSTYPGDDLRQALSALLRSRPPGEVEVALLRRPREERELIELPALAASAPDAAAARDVLDRLEALPPAAAALVVRRAGRWLTGTGGPGFLGGEVRTRVATLAREHADLEVRRALFAYAAAPLIPEELVEAALRSAAPGVRAAAGVELLRRKRPEPVWARAAEEDDAPTLLAIVARSARSDQEGATPPRDVLERALAVALDDPQGAASAVLEAAALERAAELDDGVELLAGYLAGRPARSVAEAALSLGLCGPGPAADLAGSLLERARDDDALQPVVLEALARLDPPLAEEALDAWGADLLRAGPWAEEAALTAGLLLGRGVDPGELLARLSLDPPHGLSRRARLLDVAAAAQPHHRALAARLVRALPPGRPARFRQIAGEPAV